MPNPQKVTEVADLEERIGRSQSVVLAEFGGLTVAQLTALRNELRAAGGELRVAKNTLLRLAGQNRKLAGLDDLLVGPTVVTFAYGDAVAPIKVLSRFAREHGENWRIKGGVLDGRVITAAEVAALAILPSREELLAKLAGTLLAPQSALVRVLAEPVAQVARALRAIAEQRSQAEVAA